MLVLGLLDALHARCNKDQTHVACLATFPCMHWLLVLWHGWESLEVDRAGHWMEVLGREWGFLNGSRAGWRFSSMSGGKLPLTTRCSAAKRLSAIRAASFCRGVICGGQSKLNARFHPSCMGMTIEQAKKLDHFVCSDCVKENGSKRLSNAYATSPNSEPKTESKRQRR